MELSPGMDAGARRCTHSATPGAPRSAVLGKSRSARARTRVVRAAEALNVNGGRLGQSTGARQAAGGVRILPMRRGNAVVTQAEMAQAVHGLRQLPAADIALLAQYGLSIELVPVASLEGGLVGATKIVKPEGGAWLPVRIQVAVRHGLGGDRSIGEIVQHEVGHAIAVIRSQDRSEAAAEAYAHRY